LHNVVDAVADFIPATMAAGIKSATASAPLLAQCPGMEQALPFTFDVTVLVPAYVVKDVKPILVQAFNNFAYTADLAYTACNTLLLS
jgi:hypothetical protein